MMLVSGENETPVLRCLPPTLVVGALILRNGTFEVPSVGKSCALVH